MRPRRALIQNASLFPRAEVSAWSTLGLVHAEQLVLEPDPGPALQHWAALFPHGYPLAPGRRPNRHTDHVTAKMAESREKKGPQLPYNRFSRVPTTPSMGEIGCIFGLWTPTPDVIRWKGSCGRPGRSGLSPCNPTGCRACKSPVRQSPPGLPGDNGRPFVWNS